MSWNCPVCGEGYPEDGSWATDAAERWDEIQHALQEALIHVDSEATRQLLRETWESKRLMSQPYVD